MIAKVQIDVSLEKISEFCRRWGVQEFAFFGSVLRADFQPDSDIDVLVSFALGSQRSVFDLVEMEEELRHLLARNVDLVDRLTIEQSDNYIRRRHILESAEVIYGA